MIIADDRFRTIMLMKMLIKSIFYVFYFIVFRKVLRFIKGSLGSLEKSKISLTKKILIYKTYE